jgi:hypothetical protein
VTLTPIELEQQPQLRRVSAGDYGILGATDTTLFHRNLQGSLLAVIRPEGATRIWSFVKHDSYYWVSFFSGRETLSRIYSTDGELRLEDLPFQNNTRSFSNTVRIHTPSGGGGRGKLGNLLWIRAKMRQIRSARAGVGPSVYFSTARLRERSSADMLQASTGAVFKVMANNPKMAIFRKSAVIFSPCSIRFFESIPDSDSEFRVYMRAEQDLVSPTAELFVMNGKVGLL